jgi:hypothetical protein
MGSGAKTPDRRLHALRVARALPPFVFTALVIAGCPPRDTTLMISPGGVLTLSNACKPCGRTEDGGIEPACACTIGTREPPDLDRRALQARLFLITPADQMVRDSSKCMTLLPCQDAGPATDCLAERLNQQLDGALPQGLGFDGLQNPDDVQLVLAFYQPLDLSSVSSCNRADLVACAGLAPPLGGGTYDISCASCQGGPKSVAGADNEPCPRPKNSCFLDACNSVLAMNNY